MGKRPGERLHERLLTRAEWERSAIRDGLVVVAPPDAAGGQNADRLPYRTFTSETGPFLTHAEIRALLSEAASDGPAEPAGRVAGRRRRRVHYQAFMADA